MLNACVTRYEQESVGAFSIWQDRVYFFLSFFCFFLGRPSSPDTPLSEEIAVLSCQREPPRRGSSRHGLYAWEAARYAFAGSSRHVLTRPCLVHVSQRPMMRSGFGARGCVAQGQDGGSGGVGSVDFTQLPYLRCNQPFMLLTLRAPGQRSTHPNHALTFARARTAACPGL